MNISKPLDLEFNLKSIRNEKSVSYEIQYSDIRYEYENGNIFIHIYYVDLKTKSKKNKSNLSSKIVVTNIQGNKGFIHVLDKVLLPATF